MSGSDKREVEGFEVVMTLYSIQYIVYVVYRHALYT